MRTKFDGQLELLHKELITMGALCEDAISRSAQVLASGDMALARSVPEMAGRITRKEREIEGLCIRLLLQQQPVASDLRIVSSALKMVTDLERMGDNAGDIAEIAVKTGLAGTAETESVRAMAQVAIQMVTGSIDAFVKGDVALARSVIQADDRVDDWFNQIKKDLLLRLREGSGTYALDLLMVAKYLERIGDHAVNVAQWVLYAITGERGTE